MSVASVSGSYRSNYSTNSKKLENSDHKSRTKDSKRDKSASKSKDSRAKSNPIDQFVPSKESAKTPTQHGKHKGHLSIVNNIRVNNYETTVINNNTTVNNNTTISNYYFGTGSTSGSSGTGGSNTSVNVISPDLTALTERLDAFSNKLGELSSAVASFEQLALDFENRVGKFEEGDGPTIRGKLEIDGMSFNNINFALKFARQGFDLLGILKSAGASSQSGGLSSISDSLTSSLESLKSQSKNLTSEQSSLSGLFSNNLGTALNQAV